MCGGWRAGGTVAARAAASAAVEALHIRLLLSLVRLLLSLGRLLLSLVRLLLSLGRLLLRLVRLLLRLCRLKDGRRRGRRGERRPPELGKALLPRAVLEARGLAKGRGDLGD
eukprot:5595550-Prymnesium_polylepis.1